MIDEEAVRKLLEPGAADLAAPMIAAAVSQAISLKRIADTLDGTALGVDIAESLAGLTSAWMHGRNQ